jgi:hypothetical protein
MSEHSSTTAAPPMSQDARPLVVFIAGAGRSGSTLLGDAIAQAPGRFHAGELRFVLHEIHGGKRVCGCGCSVEDCELWQAIRAHAFGPSQPPLDLERIARFSYEGMRYRSAALLRLARQSGQSVPGTVGAHEYAEALRRLYLAIAEVGGAHTIVDSSKIAMHVQLGARFAGVRAHVVHLVRDPRAIAHSWRRRSIDGVTFKPARASLSWLASNLAAGAFGEHVDEAGYTLIRYEDLIASPRATLQALSHDIGLDESQLPFVDERTLRLRANHTVAGNPSRFKQGNVSLAADEEWRTRMDARGRMLATAPAAPLLRRYGYSLRAVGGSNGPALADGLAS